MTRTNLLLAVATLTLVTGACKDGGAGNAATGGSEATVAVTAPADGDWTKSVRMTEAGGMQMGNPNAKAKLVEFGSLTCPHCADFAKNDLPKLIQDHVKTGKVAFEFRHYVRDQLDMTASLIARCNGAATYFPLLDQLYAEQKAMFERFQATPAAQQAALQNLPAGQQFQQIADMAGLTAWGAQRGLPSAKAKTCLADQKEIDRLVQMNSDATSQYQLPGTPSFLLNNTLMELPSGKPLGESIAAEINKAL